MLLWEVYEDFKVLNRCINWACDPTLSVENTREISWE